MGRSFQYGSQENAWMTKELFAHWLEVIFVKNVRKYFNGIYKNSQILLIIDQFKSDKLIELVPHRESEIARYNTGPQTLAQPP